MLFRDIAENIITGGVFTIHCARTDGIPTMIDECDDVQFARHGNLGRITLNRAASLNALTLDMVRALDARLALWAQDDSVSAVLIDGVGRAFCAGGDVRALAEAPPGDYLTADFYRYEYTLNYRIFAYPKPYISFLDGVVMGGGAGISVHGSHRLVTEASVFAMPETAIGFFPDVGGSYFLPRLPGRIGLYLGLTGIRLGLDVMYCGLATHFIRRARWDSIIEELAAESSIRGFERVLAAAAADPGPGTLADRHTAIDRCFAPNSVAGIVAELRDEAGEWAREALARLLAASPFSLQVTHRLLREEIDPCDGREAAFAAAMRREYRLSQRLVASDDFREGVRAMLVDKDRKPQWSPQRIEDVREADVNACFDSLGEDELNLTD